jgi:alkanesulfonate monooxygenase SsuD/methylene tetrahydromethanopterin reductase-like flavin-dependent oxidoreductase (luciferase family)
MKRGISLPIYNTSITEIPELAAAADRAGFDSVWSYEVYSNPFVTLAAAALNTHTIALGTGLATASTRHPMLTANAAADVDQYSGGRVLLGIGAGLPEVTISAGATPVKGLSLMREYIDQVRSCWDLLYTGEAGGFQGEFNSSVVTPAPPVGLFGRQLQRPRIPIYLAALRPKMIELGGEKAEGVLGCFYTPRFMDEVVRPRLAAGAARAGRPVADIDVVSYIICSIHDDREEAYRRARIHVGAYTATPGFDFLVAQHGLQDDQAAVRQAVFSQGPAGLETTSDRLVEAFSITGTPDEVRDKAKQYDGVLPHILLHPPSLLPVRPEETRESFTAILDLFGSGAAATDRSPAAGASDTTFNSPSKSNAVKAGL